MAARIQKILPTKSPKAKLTTTAWDIVVQFLQGKRELKNFVESVILVRVEAIVVGEFKIVEFGILEVKQHGDFCQLIYGEPLSLALQLGFEHLAQRGPADGQISWSVSVHLLCE